MALSPDGRTLVFSAVRGNQQQLYARALDQLQATPIAGTDNGASPFFSTDGRWVGFWADGALKKVALTGGGVTTVCQTPAIFVRPHSLDQDGTNHSPRQSDFTRAARRGVYATALPP